MHNRTSGRVGRRTAQGRWIASGCVSLLATALGCTPLAPGEESFEKLGLNNTDADATADAAATAMPEAATLPAPDLPEWACLPPTKITIAPRDPKPVTYVVAIVDFDSQTSTAVPVAGLNILVCDTPTCSSPAAGVKVMNPGPPLPPYFYAIELPYGFANGYLRLTAPGYTPSDYLFGGPMVGTPEGDMTVHGAIIPLLKTTSVDAIYQQVGAGDHADPKKGMLAIRTLNCNRHPSSPRGDGERAAGVQMKVIPDTPLGATSWVLFSSNLATKDVTKTDLRGVAGLVNVPAGATILVEGVAPIGAKGVEFGLVALPVRPGVVTIAEVRPGLDQWGQ